MAYNSYYPVTYQPNYYGNNPAPYYQQMQPQMQQPLQRIQQNGLVLVQSEQEARAYPVAPGNSVTFKDESQPYCYVKTMGFNQLDRPTFERYRLVKEDVPQEASESSVSQNNTSHDKESIYAAKSDLDAIWSEIEGIKEKLNTQRPAKVKRVVEVEADDEE